MGCTETHGCSMIEGCVGESAAGSLSLLFVCLLISYNVAFDRSISRVYYTSVV